MEVVVAVESLWLCVVIAKKLCGKGVDAAREEVGRIVGCELEGFRLRDDDLGDDCYAFLKCPQPPNMDGLRRSPSVITVLDSYDNPSYLTQKEVDDFLDGDASDCPVTHEGDAVKVRGDGTYAGLHGIVVTGGSEESEVVFRLHTVTKCECLSNEDLIVGENVLPYLK